MEHAVTPEHLRTLGIPLLRGRGFTDNDRQGTQLVTLIDLSTARRFWPHESPIGKRVKPVWDKDWRTIVGVVGNVKNYGITGPPEWIDGTVYLPLAQTIYIPQAIYLVARLREIPPNSPEACRAW